MEFGFRATGLARWLWRRLAASGSDSDAQSSAIDAIRAAFAAARCRVAASRGGQERAIALERTGRFCGRGARQNRTRRRAPVDCQQHSRGDAAARSSIDPCRRSGWDCLPVATGALVGIAAVALGFGAVHGITLGFGITLIGESVDYSIYFFIQSRQAQGCRRRQLAAVVVAHDPPWDADLRVRIRFAAALRDFPGLKQLGLYSISGLIAAALVTRYVLPALAAGGIRDSRRDAGWAARWPAFAGQRRTRAAAPCCYGGAVLAVLAVGGAVSRSWIPLESRAVGIEPHIDRGTELRREIARGSGRRRRAATW